MNTVVLHLGSSPSTFMLCVLLGSAAFGCARSQHRPSAEAIVAVYSDSTERLRPMHGFPADVQISSCNYSEDGGVTFVNTQSGIFYFERDDTTAHRLESVPHAPAFGGAVLRDRVYVLVDDASSEAGGHVYSIDTRRRAATPVDGLAYHKSGWIERYGKYQLIAFADNRVYRIDDVGRPQLVADAAWCDFDYTLDVGGGRYLMPCDASNSQLLVELSNGDLRVLKLPWSVNTVTSIDERFFLVAPRSDSDTVCALVGGDSMVAVLPIPIPHAAEVDSRHKTAAVASADGGFVIHLHSGALQKVTADEKADLVRLAGDTVAFILSGGRWLEYILGTSGARMREAPITSSLRGVERCCGTIVIAAVDGLYSWSHAQGASLMNVAPGTYNIDLRSSDSLLYVSRTNDDGVMLYRVGTDRRIRGMSTRMLWRLPTIRDHRIAVLPTGSRWEVLVYFHL